MGYRPTLLNSCALAATAAEARFRIDAEVDLTRVTRIVALDEAASGVVRSASEGEWGGAHFLVLDTDIPEMAAADQGVDLVLHDAKGARTHLSAELSGADSVVLVATTAPPRAAVRTIGEACVLRGIMTSGVVFGDGGDVREAVAALRPYARVLLVSRDDDDVAGLLTALRA